MCARDDCKIVRELLCLLSSVILSVISMSLQVPSRNCCVYMIWILPRQTNRTYLCWIFILFFRHRLFHAPKLLALLGHNNKTNSLCARRERLSPKPWRFTALHHVLATADVTAWHVMLS